MIKTLLSLVVRVQKGSDLVFVRESAFTMPKVVYPVSASILNMGRDVIAAECIELLSGPGTLVRNICHLESPGSARIDINSAFQKGSDLVFVRESAFTMPKVVYPVSASILNMGRCIELLSGPGTLVRNICHLESPGSARIDINSQDVASQCNKWHFRKAVTWSSSVRVHSPCPRWYTQYRQAFRKHCYDKNFAILGRTGPTLCDAPIFIPLTTRIQDIHNRDISLNKTQQICKKR
jgi:hypothetical protein